MSLTRSLKSPGFKPGGRFGLASTESRDPIGLAVAALNRVAQSDLIDRLGLRKQTEQAVFTVTRSGFRTLTTASRTFARAGQEGQARRPGPRHRGARRLRPDADRGRADARRRGDASSPPRWSGPRRPRPTRPAPPPTRCSRPAWRSGCRSSACRRRSAASPRSARRWPGRSSPRRSRTGDMGLAVAALAPGSVATALALWGTDEQQSTYLPAFTGDDVPAAALALTEPTVLFDVLEPVDHGHPRRRRLRPQRREVAGPARCRGRAVRRRRPARRQAGAVPRRVLDRRPHRRGRPVDGRPRGLAHQADPHRRPRRRERRRSARPTARPTPSACGSRASPGARSRSAPARPCSTT